MITQNIIYLVIEHWFTDDDFYDEDEARYYGEHSENAPNMFAFATKELADECIATRKISYKDHLKASEEHDWKNCFKADCAYCNAEEKHYSYTIEEINLIGETDYALSRNSTSPDN